MNQHNNAIPTPISFTLPKIGENPNLNEDACRWEPTRGLMAIADGMSNSSHPRQWANLVAEGFTSCPEERVCEYIAQNWREWLNPLQEKFHQYYLKILQQPVDTKDLKWNPAKAGIHNRSASATFVGLQIFPIDKETNTGKWQAVALGDSCLFQFRKDSDNYTLIKSLPVDKSEDFSGMTSGFSSVSDCNNEKPVLIEDEYELGDTFLLASDALSEWIHLQLEKQSVEWQGLLTITNEEQFIQFIEPLRQQHQIKNDDTTYCYYEIKSLSQDDASESSEQHYVAEESEKDGTIELDISELDDGEPVQQQKERTEVDEVLTFYDSICKIQIFSNQNLIDPKSSLVILILINTVCSLVLLVLHFLPFHINCNPIPDSTLNRENQNFDEVMTPQIEKSLDSEYVSVTESNTKKMDWLNPGTYNIYSIGLIPSKIVANCVYLTVKLYF